MNRQLTIIAVVVMITVGLWYSSIGDLPPYAHGNLHYLSQIAGNLTVVFMGLSLIMSMRMQLLEKVFGGLDKNYKFHATVGSLAFVFMVIHPISLSLNEFLLNRDNLPVAIDEALFFLVPSDVLRANLGIAAVYLTMFAFTFMTFLKIPYHHWLTTHRILGVAFLLGGIHAYMAPSNILRSPALSIWLGFWIYGGLAASIYSIVLFRRFGPKFTYILDRIEKMGDTYNIFLKPHKEKVLFVPGQFFYIRFHNQELGSEMHPFSVSSSPGEDALRFSIKELGDYTRVMDDLLKAGDTAEVYGPFGKFGKAYATSDTPLVWVAGGIGVTPFLSMLHDQARSPSQRPITFFYSLNKPEEAIFDNEISEVAKQLPQVQYIKWIAQDSGFLTADKIIEAHQTNNYKLPTTKYLLCGPPGMMHALHDQLEAKAIPDDHIIFEEFSFI